MYLQTNSVNLPGPGTSLIQRAAAGDSDNSEVKGMGSFDPLSVLVGPANFLFPGQVGNWGLDKAVAVSAALYAGAGWLLWSLLKGGR